MRQSLAVAYSLVLPPRSERTTPFPLVTPTRRRSLPHHSSPTPRAPCQRVGFRLHGGGPFAVTQPLSLRTNRG